MDSLRLQEVVIFLAAAGIVIPFGRRLRVSPVLGFLLVGLAVGPFGVARYSAEWPSLKHLSVTDVDGVHALAELGVVLLLFMIGLELSLQRLWAMRRLVFGLGSAQIGATSALIALIAWVFGNSLDAAIVLGLCLALSSTAVVVQLLTEQGRFGTRVGHGSFAILLAQDIAVVPILFIVGTLAAGSQDSLVLALGLALGKAALTVAVILIIGRLFLRPLFRFVTNAHSPEVFIAATLLIIIATAAATHAVGMSAALGAFLAGLLFAETEFRHEIEVDIEPFKGLFLGVFFMSVGMGIDLAEIVAEPLWILASIVGLFALKALVTAVCARLFGYRWVEALEVGLLLGQGGEFAFVVVALAMSFDLLPANTAQFMLIVVAATMFLTPGVARMGHILGVQLAKRARGAATEVPDVPSDLSGHVVLAGFGRTGKLLASILKSQQIAYVALDLDIAHIAIERNAGAAVFLGDASRAQLLQKMSLHRAAALLVTTDDPRAAELVVRSARQLAQTLPIVARAHDSEHGERLLALGATQVVLEVREAGLEMGRLMLEQCGLPDEVAREQIEITRTEA
jgi:monovalent cation:proton antiporter-2 (CPA2) family protein